MSVQQAEIRISLCFFFFHFYYFNGFGLQDERNIYSFAYVHNQTVHIKFIFNIICNSHITKTHSYSQSQAIMTLNETCCCISVNF